MRPQGHVDATAVVSTPWAAASAEPASIAARRRHGVEEDCVRTDPAHRGPDQLDLPAPRRRPAGEPGLQVRRPQCPSSAAYCLPPCQRRALQRDHRPGRGLQNDQVDVAARHQASVQLFIVLHTPRAGPVRHSRILITAPCVVTLAWRLKDTCSSTSFQTRVTLLRAPAGEGRGAARRPGSRFRTKLHLDPRHAFALRRASACSTSSCSTASKSACSSTPCPRLPDRRACPPTRSTPWPELSVGMWSSTATAPHRIGLRLDITVRRRARGKRRRDRARRRRRRVADGAGALPASHSPLSAGAPSALASGPSGSCCRSRPTAAPRSRRRTPRHGELTCVAGHDHGCRGKLHRFYRRCAGASVPAASPISGPWWYGIDEPDQVAGAIAVLWPSPEHQVAPPGRVADVDRQADQDAFGLPRLEHRRGWRTHRPARCRVGVRCRHTAIPASSTLRSTVTVAPTVRPAPRRAAPFCSACPRMRAVAGCRAGRHRAATRTKRLLHQPLTIATSAAPASACRRAGDSRFTSASISVSVCVRRQKVGGPKVSNDQGHVLALALLARVAKRVIASRRQSQAQ